MLGKNGKKPVVVSNVIGACTEIKGNFNIKGSARIDGIVTGFVCAESTLLIGETGRVNGNVNAENVILAGEVHGDIIVSEKIEVTASGKIYGDIVTKSLVIDEHAIFHGKCDMDIQEGSTSAVIEKEVNQELTIKEDSADKEISEQKEK